MKKVININFQGTIIPIEETAYEILQKYSESLRKHFANEEGRDEIINDIETRISELFSETLKKGSTCITDDDVNAVINSMGRPEDFDSDGDVGYDATAHSQENTKSQSAENTYSQTNTDTNTSDSTTESKTKRLYRDENHKILGGVCSGIANYFGIDPVIMRIVAIVFFGAAFIPYIVIWLVVPSTAVKAIGSPRKRLFRDIDNKRIAGVCSGIAQYFGVNTRLVRVLYLLPFISIAFGMSHMFGWSFPHFLSLSFSPAATISYIILWILVPEAKTTSDKLEMKGQPVDLNSIKNTVQNDLNEFKDKAQKWGDDLKNKSKNWGNDSQEKVKEWGDKFNEAASNFEKKSTNENSDSKNANGFEQSFTAVPPQKEKTGIPIFLKVIGYILLGLIVAPILLSLFGVGIGFMAISPATDFVLKSGWENVLAWGTFLFFIWVPIIGIILWFFRLITKSRKGSGAIRATFIGLWIIGWICFFGLFSFVGKDFSHSAFTTPSSFDYKDKNVQTMIVTSQPKDEYNNWNDQEDFNDFLRYFGNDSIRVPNVALRIETSKDENYHVESVGYSNGSSKEEATTLASKIIYSLEQKDSILLIPRDFFINRNDKFRNQRIMIKIYVPIGKQILVKENSDIKNNFDLNIGPMGVHKNNWDNTENYWDYDRLYVMTAEGLKPVNTETKEEKKNTQEKKTSKEKKPSNNDTENTDNEDGDNESAMNKNTNRNSNTASSKKISFFSVASLLSEKFFL